MRYLSVCSGMEAASVAWHPLGWTPVGFSEIEPFPCAILKHRFPNTPNYGSLTEYAQWPLAEGSIDLLVGGTPCQSFSVAGLRKGLADPRGNLALVFLGLADKLKPRWIVWENVPGVLSSAGGRDFGSFLGALVELGYGFAYRVLDAQHFGVPQRRRRVFVVACLGDWHAPAKVLLEPDCVRRDIKKGRANGQGTASGSEGGVDADGFVGVDFRHERFEQGGTVGTIQAKSSGGYSLNYAPGVAVPFRKSKRAQSTTDDESLVVADEANTLNNFDLGDTRTTHAIVEPTVYENHAQDSRVKQVDVVSIHAKAGTGGGNLPITQQAMAVRRLTPVECERLQGFPDNWSRIPWKGKPEEQCPDGPRYKACGNSMAVPVMRWIGERIQQVELSTHNKQ